MMALGEKLKIIEKSGHSYIYVKNEPASAKGESVAKEKFQWVAVMMRHALGLKKIQKY